MKLSPFQKYIGIALLLSLVICLTIHFPLVLATLFADEGSRSGHRRETFNMGLAMLELLNTFLIAFLLFILNYFIIRPFSKHRKLKWTKIIFSVILTLLSVIILLWVFKEAKSLSGLEINQYRRHGDELLLRNLFSSALVLGSIYIIRLIFQKQSYELEIEMLKSEGLQSQFESLKNQVSPHFLFNSLTALKALIPESPDTADKYVDHLSSVLRYTLQSNEKQTVTLREEMESTESYIFLIKMRYDKNLVIQTEIDTRYLEFLLPPLTLQTLIENAVKHNEISNQKPLTITIQTVEEPLLEVRNPVQKKLTREEGIGIGLNNLTKLYHLLGEKEIQIFGDDREFRVIVPLIAQVK
jgi:sensor histidine kinase YesM